MLGSLKGLFAGQGARRAGSGEFGDIAAGAKRRGYAFKRAREGIGFVVEGSFEARPWRCEWGPSHRPYIEGQELRLRMALELPPDLQMLVLTRSLLAQFEKLMFEQATASNATGVGQETPQEQRWLVMFPKIALAGSRTLRGAFGGVSSLPDEGPAWLQGPLGHALERASGTLLASQPPFVLMTLRGRLYLRLQLAGPDETDVFAAIALFEVAAQEAARVGAVRGEEPVSWSSTLSTAWQALPPEAAPPGTKKP